MFFICDQKNCYESTKLIVRTNEIQNDIQQQHLNLSIKHLHVNKLLCEANNEQNRISKGSLIRKLKNDLLGYKIQLIKFVKGSDEHTLINSAIEDTISEIEELKQTSPNINSNINSDIVIEDIENDITEY